MTVDKDNEQDADNKTETEVLDADALALAEAERELAEEQDADDGEGDAGDGEGADKSPEADKGEADADKAPDKGDGKEPMIPKSRFDEAVQRERQEKEALAERVARLEGFVQGRGDAGTTQEAKPEPTPQEQIAALRAEKAALAKKFDDGEITAVQLEAARDEIGDKIDTIRSAGSAPAAAQPTTDAYVEDQAVAISQEHPYLEHLAPSNGGNRLRWNALQNEAIANLVDEGIKLGSDGRSRIAIYREMAKLSDDYGSRWTGKTPEEVGLKKAPDPNAEKTVDPNPGSPPPTGKAEARREKLEAAATHPPDAAGMGKGAGGSDAIGEADIMKMSDAELEAMLDKAPAVGARFDPAAKRP